MQNRRTLHEPFFPTLPSAPPASQPPPPSIIPPSSQPFPKYPFSSSPLRPFFPIYPSPPPPPFTSNVPSFPANISSLIYPNSAGRRGSLHSHSTRSLLPAILISLILLSVLSLSAAFLFHRRHRRHLTSPTSPPRPNPNRKKKGNKHANQTPAPPPPPPPASASYDFYMGIPVHTSDPNVVPSGSSPLQKVGSPQLRPLPPLSKAVGTTNYANATDSDDEFYSPKGSDNPFATTNGSSSRKDCVKFQMSDEKSGSDFSSTPAYPESNSDGSRSDSSSPLQTVNWAESKQRPRSTLPPVVPPPIPPPPPLLAIRPLTPSPPKRKLSSPSPISSPFRNSRVSVVRSPVTSQPPMQEPPPPPPPPPVGYWESQVRQRPVVATSRSVNFKTFIARGAELADGSDSVERCEEATSRPKLKPLHWDKVRASSDCVMVWDQLKSSSFQVNEEMIETLFGCCKTNAASNEVNKRLSVSSSPKQVDRVLDPKKSQNIAILLRALSVSKYEICEALLEGNTESLGADLFETLLKMAPSEEEELKLKEYKDDATLKLGPAEKFLKDILDIPFAFKRVDAMLYIANFDSEISYLRNSFETLEAACEELRSSRLFLKLLEAVLKTGNRMNVGTNRGDALAFKLDTLLKLVDVKGTDGKTTLLHFVVQEIIRTEGSRRLTAKTQANILNDDLQCKKLGLQIVSGVGGELGSVKRAASLESEVLSSYIPNLASGIGKISEVLRLNESLTMIHSSSMRFHKAMNGFLKKAEDEIISVQAQESVALSLVKEITEYFHGNSTKEEANPFRIFMVVRDFLSVLDQVCKEVGMINEQSIASSMHQFPVPVNPTLPLLHKIHALRPESSDDESSSSLS